MDAIQHLWSVKIVVHRCLAETEVHTNISCASNEEKMMIQKNKIIAIYLFIYIFLYIVCVSLEQYMQQPLNGVTSYWAATLWGRGNKLQAGEGNQQKQAVRHECAPSSKPPERGLVGCTVAVGWESPDACILSKFQLLMQRQSMKSLRYIYSVDKS